MFNSRKTKKSCIPSITAVLAIILATLACDGAATSTSMPTNTPPPPSSLPTPTATPSPTLPQPTSTPTPTPEPTLEATSDSISADFSPEFYYPLVENQVRWYLATSADSEEGGDLVSIAVIGTETLSEDTPVHLVELTDSGGSTITYEEFTEDAIFIHRLVYNPPSLSASSSQDLTFVPPILNLRFPLEDEMTWSGEFTLGTESFTYVFTVTSLPTVSISKSLLFDCFRVVRARNGNEDHIAVYCPGFGLVMYESLTSSGWIQAEMIEMTTARVSLQDVVGMGANCGYVLQGIGFLPDEEVTIGIVFPAEQAFADGKNEMTLTGTDVSNSFTILLRPEQVASGVMIGLVGSDPAASLEIPPGPRRAFYMIRPSDNCQ